ncbi:MAG: hypothetical protein M9953_02515 [Thermomicrobiales bacterium]|nr:hypothetical protein [Thermomicrobiales bacterium]MCO5229433.1 hypothetical protein [Thermomicrobiales bacterium]
MFMRFALRVLASVFLIMTLLGTNQLSAQEGVSESPGIWAPETAVLACTPNGVNVTFTISGAEFAMDYGDVADIQIRRSTGGIPIESAFETVVQGNPGPYVVEFTSEDLASGSFQAWVFKVGTSDPVKSEVVTCESNGGEILPTPSATLTPTETPVMTETPTETQVVTETPTETSVVTETPTEVPTETITPEAENTLVVTIALPDNTSIDGAPYSLYAAQASIVFESEPYRSGFVGANNTIEIADLLAGTYMLGISPEGMGPIEAVIEVGDQSLTTVRLTVNNNGSVTVGDVPQVTPTTPTEEEVTALPSTGTGAFNGSMGIVVMLGSALMMAGGLAMRIRRS